MSNIFTRLLLNTDGFNKNLYQAQKNLKGFAATSKGVFGGLTQFTSYAAAFVGISTSIHSAVTANMEFEKSLSSLRSLTGVSADELNYFRTEAIRMGMDSTQSASQMVDAYKLIGSQMPELLKNKEALSATARAAVTLAEAAEIDVPTAAKALTGSLNQMGESSSRASEYINILAAASQQGSADIPYLNKAIENSGGTASSVGVKFNELVAAIEAIAPRITDASSAGTNLRNIFLTLEASTDNNLKPSVVGLSAAIDNLSKKNLNATELTKMFGKESVTAAIAILQEKDAFDKLSQSIKNTNTAYDQAEINNDNLAGSIGKLQSSWTSFINTMAGSNGILKGIVDELRDAVNWANRAMMTANERYQYDTQKSRIIEREESNKRIQKYIDNGMSIEDALNKEIQNANYMYPDANTYQVRERNLERKKREWEKAKLININSSAPEEEKAYQEALKLYKIAKDEYTMRQVIYDNVEAQRKSLEQANKEEEKTKAAAEAAAKAAKEKAAAEEATKLAKEKASRPEGSIADLDYQIREQQKKLVSATTTEARVSVQETINELESKKIRLQAEVETAIFQKGRTDHGLVEERKPNLGSLAGGIDLGKIEIPSLQDNISEANDYASSLANVVSAFSMITKAQQADEASVSQWALQSISNIAGVISKVQELAISQGVASAAKLPPPFNIAAMTSVVSTIIGIFASMPKFANGGIVGGNSYFGDKLLARVNSGEMILNKGQQAKLYRMTEDNRNGITIGFDRVRGSDIYLSLKNYLKETGKKL